ncbi:MAG: hypothetical protein ACLVKO_06455 [Dysgonomonas sp.]
MKKLFKNIIAFLACFFVVALIIILLPPTPKTKESLIFSSEQKDSLLLNTPEPRIILVGGSNIAMGMNSRIIKDSLNLNPINTGFHAGVGLKFMLDHVEPYLRKGDVLILIPEYNQFYNRSLYGNEVLLRMILDVSFTNAKQLDINQWFNIMQYLPNYLKSKVNLSNYVYSEESLEKEYLAKSFNKYGDAVAHWNLPKTTNAKPLSLDQKNYNPKAMQYMHNFIDRASMNGVKVYVSYPGMRENELKNIVFEIEKIYKKK